VRYDTHVTIYCKSSMKKRTLGKSELRLSQMALGTWGLAAQSYGPVSDAEADHVIRGALDEGIQTFDMAPLWGDGRSEILVGRAVRTRRDRVQLITRAGAVWKDGRVHRRFDAASLAADFEASASRLGTDRIDVWLLHNPPDHVFTREDWVEVAQRLKAEGKVGMWGASVSSPDQARRAIALGAGCVCLVYNLLASDDLDDLATDLAVSGCGVLARSPLAYGLLAGTWTEERDFPKEDHRQSRWTSDALRQRVRQVGQLNFLVRDGVADLTAAALRFVLSNPHVACTLVGARTRQQVGTAAAAVRLTHRLDEEDLARISQVLAATGA
jgi:aryl-alcohol dehydrogenase-like predicted oxidoreductase